VIDMRKLILDWNGKEIKEKSFRCVDESFFNNQHLLNEQKGGDGEKEVLKAKQNKKKEEFDPDALGFDDGEVES
jgi:hypothetical protein